MRSAKLFTALAAAFTALLLGFTTVPAQAAKPPHEIRNLSAGETSREGVFYAKALAVTAKGQRIYLQARPAGTTASAYSTRKSAVSDPDTGRFVFRFSGSCGSYWRLYIREDRQQRGTSVYLGRIYCD